MAAFQGQSNFFQEPSWYEEQRLGGGRYPDRVPVKRKFYGTEDHPTEIRSFAAGQVLKAGTFVVADNNGDLIAADNLVETATLTFNSALVSGNTVVISITGAAASITFTVGSGGASAAQLATAISVLTPGITTTNANIALLAASIPTTVGTFTAMTVGAPSFGVSKSDANTVVFHSITALTDVTTLTVASTGTVHTLATRAGSATFRKPVGVTVCDVDATSSVRAPIYKEGFFFGNDDGRSWLRWFTDPEETVFNAETNTEVAVSAYNTGCFGTSVTADKLKQMYVDGTEFNIYLFEPGANVYLEGAL